MGEPEKQPDRRGVHWAPKVTAGEYTSPSCKVRDWADNAKKLESQLQDALAKHGRSGACALPWEYPGVKSVRPGGCIRAHFTQLLIHHLNGVVEVQCSNGGDPFSGNGGSICNENDFMGIESFKVLNRDAFNANEMNIHTIEWAKANPDAKTKTIAKHWNFAGMVEIKPKEGGPLVYVFDARMRKMYHGSATRAIQKRKVKDGQPAANDAKRLKTAAVPSTPQPVPNFALQPKATPVPNFALQPRATPVPNFALQPKPAATLISQKEQDAAAALQSLMTTAQPARIAAIMTDVQRASADSMRAEAAFLRAHANQLEIQAAVIQPQTSPGE
jgi:hypothetical protein